MHRRKWHTESPSWGNKKRGSPFPHHSQPNEKPRKRNCTGALYKAQRSARAQRAQLLPCASELWEDGYTSRDQSILWLHVPGQMWAVPLVWGWTHRQGWESGCSCWGCLLLFAGFNWEVPHEEETTRSMGEGNNGTAEESNPSLRSIPPLSAVRSSTHRRALCTSIGNDRTVNVSSI